MPKEPLGDQSSIDPQELVNVTMERDMLTRLAFDVVLAWRAQGGTMREDFPWLHDAISKLAKAVE